MTVTVLKVVMKISLFLFFFLYSFLFISNALMLQSDEFALWKGAIPGAKYKPEAKEDTLFLENGIRIKNVISPTLRVYLPDSAIATGASVIICPGGAYERLAIEHEGYEVGSWFVKRGIAAFLLKYRLPSDSLMNDKSVGPLSDVQEAIRLLRRESARWKINPSMIGIMGFSAGGHLAASASTLYADSVYAHDGTSARPDFSILVYPVISMNDSITHKKSKLNLLGAAPTADKVLHYSAELQVRPSSPITYLVHSLDDTSVPVENSKRYYQALLDNSVAAELHLYKTGGHGYGLKGRGGDESKWTEGLEKWLIANKIAHHVKR